MLPFRCPQDNDFRDRLKLCIERAGSVRALSRASGVSEAMLYRYLAGQCDPSRRTLLALAGATDVGVGWLAAGEATP